MRRHRAVVDLRSLAGGVGLRSNTFASDGAYVSGVARQAWRLVRDRYLLPEDAALLVRKAAASDVGGP